MDTVSLEMDGVSLVGESGADFTSQQTVPVAVGGYVLRHACTRHDDGVPNHERSRDDRRLWGRAGRYPPGRSRKAVLAADLGAP
jgi:hypothetical protein